MALIRIPTPLRKFTDGKDEVSVQGGTVGELLTNLERSAPGIRARICDEAGKVRRFVNIFVGDEDIRYLNHLDTVVTDDAEVSIIPAIAGG
jgi:molybdopterin converting factor small subunit